MRIYSWNVNGLRSCAKKGFRDWLESSGADIVGLQEVRATAKDLPADIRQPAGWNTHFFPAAIKMGYSGVGIYSRRKWDKMAVELGEERFDREGRVQVAKFGQLRVLNVYFPNGSGRQRDLSRIPYKLDFYEHLRRMLHSELESGVPVVVMGDFNTAHREIDLARPASNRQTSGFRPEERQAFQAWLNDGWTDTFRHFCPDPDHYTWWTYRGNCRARNVGWRIDYILVSPGAINYVTSAAIHSGVMGSDHCPISIDLDEEVLQGDM